MPLEFSLGICQIFAFSDDKISHPESKRVLNVNLLT